MPDPYYGGPRGFEDVLDLVGAACAGLLEEVRERLRESRGGREEVVGYQLKDLQSRDVESP